MVNAVLYPASPGCQRRMLPKDFPPVSTVQRYFYDWCAGGLWCEISNMLVRARTLAGREPLQIGEAVSRSGTAASRLRRIGVPQRLAIGGLALEGEIGVEAAARGRAQPPARRSRTAPAPE